MEASRIVSVLERCEFFRGIEKSYLEKIAGLCRPEAYEPGEYVFRQGDFGDQLYVITEGHVYLERSTDLDTHKGQVIIGMLGKGRVLGCWSTLLDEPHHLMSSASCQKPTKVLAFRGSELRQMMLSNMTLGFSILQRLCFLLRDRIQGAYGALEKI